MNRALMGLVVALCLPACGEDGNDTPASGPTGTGGTTASSGGTGPDGSSGSGANGAGGGGAGSGAGGAGGGDIPGGGVVLFEESFDDANFMARDWYDGPSGTISTAETAPGSASSFECLFQSGATSCAAGKPARHKFADSESVYLGFWLKFASNWVGSGVAYHPHMLHFLTNLDSDFVGPSSTHLTTYTEVVNGRALLALQDSTNVDTNCILLNNDTFVGCNGDFDSYVFTEDRSVCACNGLVGFLDGRDCFDAGSSWYSARLWTADNAFTDDAWHFVEVYFEMNTIDNGVGIADGKIRWVQDGQTLITSDEILMRTGANPTMAFNQFAMLPYIGVGSPIAQSFWIDDLVVATAKP
jgi:hypothetical protein